jgi:ABC-type antimicrobial peptide transport system permease subunit
LTAATGLVAGTILALALGRTLEAMLYGVNPRDAWSFVVAALVASAATATAAFLPARRATRVDPATVLRAE